MVHFSKFYKYSILVSFQEICFECSLELWMNLFLVQKDWIKIFIGIHKRREVRNFTEHWKLDNPNYTLCSISCSVQYWNVLKIYILLPATSSIKTYVSVKKPGSMNALAKSHLDDPSLKYAKMQWQQICLTWIHVYKYRSN